MRHWLSLFTVCLLVTAQLAAQPPKAVSTKLFDATVSSDWEEQMTRSAVYYLYPGKDIVDIQTENICIIPTSVSSGMGLDSYTFMAKFQIERDFPELSLSSSKATKLGPVPAHRFEFKGTRNGKKFSVIQVMGLHGSNGYTVQFAGTDANYNLVRNGFENLIRTFTPK
jgi:hypothetical protein